MRWKGSAVGVVVAVALLAAGGCSQQEIVVDGSRPDTSVQDGPSMLPSGAGGSEVPEPDDATSETSRQASTLAARLSTAPIAGLGPVERRALLGIGLRAAGLTVDEAGCITSDPLVGDDPTVASPIQGVPPEVLARCVPGPRLAQLASNPSLDLGAVDLGDLAAVVTPAVRNALESSGLQPAEADCVAKAVASSVDVQGLGALLGGTGNVPSIDSATVIRCIGASRIDELSR